MNNDFMRGTHFVTNIIIQANLLAMIIWYYDTDISLYFFYTLFCAVCLCADYGISRLILRKKCAELKSKQSIHLPDLLFTAPSILIVIREICKIIISGYIGRPRANIIATIVLVLIINALLVAERIALLKKV